MQNKILSISDLYPSRFLKASDLGDDDLILTIDHVTLEPLGGNMEKKPVVYFKEAVKPLVLIKTNCYTLGHLYGDNVDDWAGKKVALYKTPVPVQGDTKFGIRIRSRAPSLPSNRSEVIPEPPEPPDLWA